MKNLFFVLAFIIFGTSVAATKTVKVSDIKKELGGICSYTITMTMTNSETGETYTSSRKYTTWANDLMHCNQIAAEHAARLNAQK